MAQFLHDLSQLPPGTLAVIAALAGAIGAVLAALVTASLGKLIVTPFLSARDRQDKEAEWRKHALELTKLDLERKIKTRSDVLIHPLRPSILDFLANYRELQELGTKSPKELYLTIINKRTTAPAVSKAPSISPPSDVEAATNVSDGDRVIFVAAAAVIASAVFVLLTKRA